MAKKKGTYMEFVGVQDFLNALEAAGDDAFEGMQKALEEGAQVPSKTMQDFMEPAHHRSGYTIRSFTVELKANAEKGTIKQYIGFDTKKGGMPALFFDIGAPTIQPTYYVRNARETYKYDMIAAMKAEVMRMGRKLGGS